MKIKPFILILILLCTVIANGQRKQSATQTQPRQAEETAEMAKLRDEYIKATKDYKASLGKLLLLYQESQKKAEDQFARSKELFAQGLIRKEEVDRSERAIADAKVNVEGVQNQIGDADALMVRRLVELQNNEAKLAREYRRASARQPSCRNWTLTASRHQRGRTVTMVLKLVCKD